MPPPSPSILFVRMLAKWLKNVNHPLSLANAAYFILLYCFYVQKQFDNQVPINELVTCSNITDPRIQFEVDVASALTLVFKSNDENEFQGIDFYILEIDPSVRMQLI